VLVCVVQKFLGNGTQTAACRRIYPPKFAGRVGFPLYRSSSWVSTSVQNFVRMTLMKRGFVCSILPRLQVLRPPIQPNHRLLNPRARTDPAGWHDLAQCRRRYEDRLRPPSALEALNSCSRLRTEAVSPKSPRVRGSPIFHQRFSVRERGVFAKRCRNFGIRPGSV
jgi:hypothetical protein